MAGEFTKFGTVSTVLGRITSELGLATPASYVGNTDTTTAQVLNMLTSAGQDLCLMNDWQYLHKEWSLTLNTIDTEYDLPDDWNSFVDSTMWNNASSLPVIGPLTPQAWRMLKARFAGGASISLQYRITGNQFVLFEAASAADTIITDYYSRGWILQVDGITFRDNPAADDDTILFDQRIVIPLVKLRWRAGKGFDTMNDVQDFNDAWDLVTGRDIPAPTLSLGTRSVYPYLGYGNMPDTGYGT
jgi:hypothetical protein